MLCDALAKHLSLSQSEHRENYVKTSCLLTEQSVVVIETACIQGLLWLPALVESHSCEIKAIVAFSTRKAPLYFPII